MNKLLFLMAVLCIFSSCRREEESQTSVTGTVIDRETQAPIAGATVYFMKQDQNNPGVYVHFHQMTSDANGAFTHSFTAEADHNYYTYATYQNYLMNGFVFTPAGQSNQVNILLSKPGYMAIHVQNTSPIDSTDKISIYDSDYWTYEHLFTGTSVDTTIVITHYGNQTNTIKWKVTKSDTTISYNQSFNFIAFDTLAFDLFY